MALLFVRHGSTGANAGDSGDGFNTRDYFRGMINVPLSQFGRQTLAQTAAWFKGKPIDQIIASPLARAFQSATAIGQATGAPVQADSRLLPWNIGALSGQLITPERKELANRLQTTSTDEAAPGGEPYSQFEQRYSSILPELLNAAQSKNIVVVAHHRNALALNKLLYGGETRTSGPPDPGGVALVGKSGLMPLFTPPAVAANEYKKEATS